ncbi:hypothetical protein GWK47_054030 [Chionoecetes opilio]|uniref:Uncharacterized protein n=1 Tax=Chionoecetes opilio TaxID=41210 RepID=A0A8J4Y052_CHIOP|nr:hypothetical protein GWK47_054030 [Chionoecetes opilio]
MGQRFGIPEELSVRWGNEPHSQESRGFLDTWRVRLRVFISTLPPVPNGRAKAAVQVCQEVATRHTGRTAPLDTDAAALGPSCQYLPAPPAGLRSLPSPADHRTSAAGCHTCGHSALGAIASSVKLKNANRNLENICKHEASDHKTLRQRPVH